MLVTGLLDWSHDDNPLNVSSWNGQRLKSESDGDDRFPATCRADAKRDYGILYGADIVALSLCQGLDPDELLGLPLRFPFLPGILFFNPSLSAQGVSPLALENLHFVPYLVR